MQNIFKFIIFFLFLLFNTNTSQSFCGFYVGKSDNNLFNESSKVVMVHKDNKNVITMVNDYQGEVNEFAMVVPVPEVLQEGQINVTKNKIIDHLDAYSAPRLVEYFDNDPCQIRMLKRELMAFQSTTEDTGNKQNSKTLGVKIEAKYTVGEYDIIILSAKESNGLETWLKQNKYKIPEGASRVLESYIKQGMKFFVAKVNLKKFNKSGNVFLNPLQIAFESNKFMLPIRLGTVNAKGKQDLFIYTLSSKGRIESSNYRTVQIPSNINLPVYVKNDFGKTYKAIYKTAVKKENYGALFTEYAWDMNWCDPCAADPLSREELKELGVFWLDEKPIRQVRGKPILGPVNVFVTRLHVTYDSKTFPEDLMFIETSDRNNFQGRYILQNPWKGESKCPEAKAYFDSLNDRFEKEARNLSNLTGWDINKIRKEMKENGQNFEIRPKKHWWEDLWNNKKHK